jgi:hypothetical protein
MAMKHLRQAIDFKASELLSFDLLLAVGGAVGGTILGLRLPRLLGNGLPVAAGLVGVVIGAVLAGVAVQAAFMDQAFLRKVAKIGREPVFYLAPFLFTATLGVLAALGVLVLSFTTVTAASWWRGTAAGVTGFLTVYTLTSLLNGLDNLVQFVGLKALAAEVADDLPTSAVPLERVRRAP